MAILARSENGDALPALRPGELVEHAQELLRAVPALLEGAEDARPLPARGLRLRLRGSRGTARGGRRPRAPYRSQQKRTCSLAKPYKHSQTPSRSTGPAGRVPRGPPRRRDHLQRKARRVLEALRHALQRLRYGLPRRELPGHEAAARELHEVLPREGRRLLREVLHQLRAWRGRDRRPE